MDQAARETVDGSKAQFLRPPGWQVAVPAFLILYLLLARLDGLSSTPSGQAWDLAGGLAFAFILRRGALAAIIAAVAELAASLIRSTPGTGVATMICNAVVLGLSYGLAGTWLLRRGIRRLNGQPALLALSLAALAAASGRALAGHAVAFAATGHLPDLDYLTAALLSGLLGITVVAPVAMTLERPRWPVGWQAAAEIALLASALAGLLALILPPDPRDPFRYFYLLFLPQIWIAVRFGARGAALSTLAVQLGLVLFLGARPDSIGLALNYQVRLLALAASSLFLGAAVTERRAAEQLTRQRQEELARVGRLSMAGQMAAALAHDLNQPLMAAMAFARTAQLLIAQPDVARSRIDEALGSTVAETERAADIIRSLRRFIGRSDSDPGYHAFEPLAREAVTLIGPECALASISLSVSIDRPLPRLHVDAVQVRQVLFNLMHNAFEAIRDAGPGRRLINLRAWRGEGEIVCEIADTGPGVPDGSVDVLFEPFVSNKPGGMGLGLAICRGIVEAQGGRLWLERNRPGDRALRFTLAVEEEAA